MTQDGGVLSVALARALRDAGLRWAPARGDNCCGSTGRPAGTRVPTRPRPTPWPCSTCWGRGAPDQPTRSGQPPASAKPVAGFLDAVRRW